MTSEVRRVRLAKLFGILRFAVLAAAMVPASLHAHAQAFTLPPPEKVPTLLGIDLPLRPGERLVPIGTGDCSAVVFAPREKLFQVHKTFWSEREWFGACRFGLAHGEAYLKVRDSVFLPQKMMYGVPVPAAEELRAERHDVAFFSGTAFHDPSAKTVKMFDLSRDLGGTFFSEPDFLSQHLSSLSLEYTDSAGVGRQTLIHALDMLNFCSGHGWPLFEAFSGEIKKSCRRKTAEKLVLVRSEVLQGEYHGDFPPVWLKACAVSQDGSSFECGKLLKEALGKDFAEVQSIMAGSRAARAAANQEIFARYAPLEAALEARLKDKVAAGGAQ
ncbi:hypothetical protein [Hyphomonas sp.]|uniref:hypothetical protein n=1 Tax=Hyphomonas sp. TaxID=87 RepID=UPI0025C40160|nr:hypothetical protein [Hyphomonas sp.]